MENKSALRKLKKVEETVGERDIAVSDCCGAIVWELNCKCPICKKDATAISEAEYESSYKQKGDL